MKGFIGGGNMAEAMIKGMLSKGLKEILVAEPRDERRQYLKETYNISTTSDNRYLVKLCKIIILSVKPQILPQVLEEISEDISDEKTVVSITAGIPLSYLQSKLNTNRVVRVMPNTPALVQSGMSVISQSDNISDKDISEIKIILNAIGKVLILPEKYMDAVTALSGSGPAFISFFIESMIKGGEKVGLSRDVSQELVIQTLVGTTELLNRGIDPSDLMIMVTSPGGTTEAGLKVFFKNDLMDVVLDTIITATKRSEELGKQVAG